MWWTSEPARNPVLSIAYTAQLIVDGIVPSGGTDESYDKVRPHTEEPGQGLVEYALGVTVL